MGKNIGYYQCLLVLGLSLVGCKEIQIKDGQIPTQYKAAAQKYMGSYSGKFEGIPGKINLTLEGNIVHINYTSEGGNNDILGAQCESNFGNLETIYISGTEEKPTLDQANFKFNPNRCGNEIKGRTLYLYFKNKSGVIYMDASIVKRQEWEHRCDGSSPPPAGCREHPVNVFIRGSFQKT